MLAHIQNVNFAFTFICGSILLYFLYRITRRSARRHIENRQGPVEKRSPALGSLHDKSVKNRVPGGKYSTTAHGCARSSLTLLFDASQYGSLWNSVSLGLRRVERISMKGSLLLIDHLDGASISTLSLSPFVFEAKR